MYIIRYLYVYYNIPKDLGQTMNILHYYQMDAPNFYDNHDGIETYANVCYILRLWTM